MTKVVHILTDSNIGGAGRYLINYLKYRNTEEFSVSVILPTGSLLIPEIRSLDVPVLEADGIAEKSFSISAIGRLRKILRKEHPDIVHTHGSFSGRIAARQCGAKIIYTRHSVFPVSPRLQRGLARRLNNWANNRFADCVIAVSPAAEQNLLDSGVSSEKIITMMNGTAPLTKASPERCRELRRQLHLPSGVFTVGILARLEMYKGHTLLLDAAKRLKDEGRNFRILIGGAGTMEPAIRKQIAALGLSDRVLFLGFVENVSEIMSLLDVQVNCSWGTEATSLSLLEGMSIGVPAVASDYGGNPYVIDDGETGLLFPSGDSAALADRLRNLMDRPELCVRLGQNARGAYSLRFTAEIFARNIESVYRQTLQK